MKRFRLFWALLLLATLQTAPILAQGVTYYEVEEYTPTVYMIAVGETLQEYDPEASRQAVVDDFKKTHRCGFQQSHNPQFIFATRNNRFALGIGGFVNLRTSFDFDGAMGNIDFIPYDIPMSKGYANKQRIMMDASTSRVFLKAIINSQKLGKVQIYTDIDFRGGDQFSYIPRLRSAYILWSVRKNLSSADGCRSSSLKKTG